MPPRVTPADPPRLMSRSFVLATVANLCFFVGVTVFFVLPVYLERLGAGRAEIGRVMGMFGTMSLIAIPMTGTLVDRWGKRPFMIVGGLAWAAASLAFLAVDAVDWLPYALRVVQGTAFSLAFVATNALIVDLAPAGGLGRALSLFGTTTLATHAIGPTLGEAVSESLGYSALFVISACAAIGAVAAYIAIDEPERSREREESGPSPSLAGLAFRRGATGALVGGVTSALAFGTAMHFMPVFVVSRGLKSYSPFFVSYVFAAVLVRLAAGGLGDRLGHRRVSLVAMAVFSCAVASLSQVGSTWQLALAAVAFGASHGWAYPALNALFLAGVRAGGRGRAMALFNLSFNVGITLAAFLGGEIAERAGYPTMWLCVAAGAAIGILALVVDRGPQRDGLRQV